MVLARGFPLRPDGIWVVGLELSKEPIMLLICPLRFLPMNLPSGLNMGEPVSRRA